MSAVPFQEVHSKDQLINFRAFLPLFHKLGVVCYPVRLQSWLVCPHTLITSHISTRNNSEASNRMILTVNLQCHFEIWGAHQIQPSTCSLFHELCCMWHHVDEITCQPSSTRSIGEKKVAYHRYRSPLTVSFLPRSCLRKNWSKMPLAYKHTKLSFFRDHLNFCMPCGCSSL